MEEEEEEGGGGGAPAWMATFADMMSLLLTFFVLLLSFANMDVQYFQLALGSVKHALGVKSLRPGHMEVRHTSPIEWEKEVSSSKGSVGDQQSILKIEAFIQRRKLSKNIKVKVTENNIILKVYGLFAPGSADLDPRRLEELNTIVDVCNLFDQPVTVEAHTDDRPIRTPRFNSNWSLSAVRAGAVTRFLAESGVEEERLTASGLAHLRPIATNRTAKGRAQNRRVAIVMMRKRTKAVQETDTDVWR